MSHLIPRHARRFALATAAALLLGACASTRPQGEPAPTLPAWDTVQEATPEARDQLEAGLSWIIRDAADPVRRTTTPRGRSSMAVHGTSPRSDALPTMEDVRNRRLRALPEDVAESPRRDAPPASKGGTR